MSKSSNKKPEDMPRWVVIVAFCIMGLLIYSKATSTSENQKSEQHLQVQKEDAVPNQIDGEKAKVLAASMANMNGHLCAEVVEIRPLKVRPEIHEIVCIEYRGGTGRKMYLLDTKKGTVWIP